ncbi:protein of unknown function [Hyphomicrobium sp. 1Nfss2.1]
MPMLNPFPFVVPSPRPAAHYLRCTIGATRAGALRLEGSATGGGVVAVGAPKGYKAPIPQLPQKRFGPADRRRKPEVKPL